MWATNSGGSSEITLEGTENSVIDIQTTSFAIDVDAWAVDAGYAGSQGITLKANDVKVVSTESRAVIIGNGYEGADSTLKINAQDSIYIEGKTNGIEISHNDDSAKSNVSFVATAGKQITISGETTAINDAGYEKTKVEFETPNVVFQGDVEAAATDMILTSGSQAAVAVSFDGNFKVQELSGDSLNLNAIYDDAMGEIQIGTNNTTRTDLTVTGQAASKLTQQEALEYLNAVELGTNTNYTASLENAAWGVEVSADAEGNLTTRTTASSLTKSTMDLAALTMVAWRNETTTLTDRMASLRTNPYQYGAWVRFNGGEYSYDARGVSNQFQMLEVGGDAKLSDAWLLGASLSYTKGNGDLNGGETDSDTYALALYALWNHESGSFVDVMGKVGRLLTDFDFRDLSGVRADHGSLDQTGYIFGVETGHRFKLAADMAFVEPQIQLTYSRLGSDNETTADRVIEIESTDSLIGRVGVVGGLVFPDKCGSIYARVSALHDFLGDVEGSFRDTANTQAIRVSEEMDGTWVEFSLGGDYRVSDNAFVYADLQRSAGGDIGLDWRANIGAKFVW